jgi:hypothetical protein
MKFQEKSLELNITHELLNLTDSWHWFLSDIPLWRYWRPRYRLPFLKFPKSTSGGFHITSEGKSDPTGEKGGGYDVRIKSGFGGHLLFVQYKMGELISKSPDPKSIFSTAPFEHYKFKINSTTTNQHFLLRELSDGIGKVHGNAVVYALPLIGDMNDLESNAGKLIRKTKFISIKDIDAQALINKVTITKNVEHNFRVGQLDMNRCEVNFFFFFFAAQDKGPEIIADIIALSFQKTLLYFINQIEENYMQYNLYQGYITEGLQRAFGQYLRYLLHYFEVSPKQLRNTSQALFREYNEVDYLEKEFSDYESTPRDIEIITTTFNALNLFSDYINNSVKQIEKEFKLNREMPVYKPSFLISSQGDNGFQIKFSEEFSAEEIENISYLVI